MKSVLMHKNISVAMIEYTDGHIIEVNEILDKEHMPVGTYRPDMTNSICCTYLKAWQRSRAIPGDRVNLAAILDSSGKDIFQLGALATGWDLRTNTGSAAQVRAPHGKKSVSTKTGSVFPS